MVWGQKRGIDDLVERLLSNDVKLQSLTILSGRTFGDEEASKLFAALASNTVLTELNASGRPLARRAAAELAKALASNEALTKLSVGDADTSDEAVQELAEGLMANAVLRELDLEKKAVGARGVAALAGSLQRRSGEAPGLALKLSGNRLGGREAAAALAEALPRLRELELADCGLAAEDLEQLLPCGPSLALRALVLSGNSLAGSCLTRLPAASPALRSLELRSAHLRAADVDVLAQALERADRPLPLQRLGVADNGLGADAGPAVGRVLLACPSLKALDLHSNPLQDGGIAAICSTLAASGAKPPLAALDLTNCKITTSAVRELACMEALEELRLVGNDLSGSGLAPLLDAAAATGAWAVLRQLAVAACNLPDLDEHLRALCLPPQPLLPALEMVEVARNPGVDREGFEELVKECSYARPGLHIAWRGGAGEDPAELTLHHGRLPG